MFIAHGNNSHSLNIVLLQSLQVCKLYQYYYSHTVGKRTEATDSALPPMWWIHNWQHLFIAPLLCVLFPALCLPKGEQIYKIFQSVKDEMLSVVLRNKLCEVVVGFMTYVRHHNG